MTFNPIDRDVKAIFFFFITIISNKVSAHILELLPQYQQNKRFYVDRRSDLWGDPNHNKSNSMRIYDISAEVDLYKAEDKNAFVQADVEGLSTDRADLLVGRNRILVGGDLRNQSAGFGFVKRVDHSGWCIAILLGRFHGKTRLGFRFKSAFLASMLLREVNILKSLLRNIRVKVIMIKPPIAMV